MTSPFDGYEDHFNEEARLVILKALRDEPNGRLSDSMLMRVLEAFAINRSREWVRTQLFWMRRETQAVVLTEAGTAVIAELTQQGEDHLERRTVLVGIKSPSRPRG